MDDAIGAVDAGEADVAGITRGGHLAVGDILEIQITSVCDGVGLVRGSGGGVSIIPGPWEEFASCPCLSSREVSLPLTCENCLCGCLRGPTGSPAPKEERYRLRKTGTSSRAGASDARAGGLARSDTRGKEAGNVYRSIGGRRELYLLWRDAIVNTIENALLCIRILFAVADVSANRRQLFIFAVGTALHLTVVVADTFHVRMEIAIGRADVVPRMIRFDGIEALGEEERVRWPPER